MVNNKDSKKGTTGVRKSASKRAGGASARDAIPNVYQEMLADAVSSSPTRLGEGGRTVKRRRVGGRVVTQSAGDEALHHSDHASTLAGDTDAGESNASVNQGLQQTVYNDSDDSADSDMDWEEVELKAGSTNHAFNNSADDEGPMELTLGDSGDEHAARGLRKRKPVTTAEKKIRLEVHKMHLLSLLAHVYKRNYWCNKQEIRVRVVSRLSRSLTHR